MQSSYGAIEKHMVNDDGGGGGGGGGGVANRRRRELQVCRAEREWSVWTAKNVCREMADRRAELDTAVEAYERRRAELAAREAATHDRLASVLRDRSAAEWDRETIRDRVENELKAQRTAGTVRVYRLDVRCRQLHDRYRGFVVDVLKSDDGRPSREQRRFLEPEWNDQQQPPVQRRFFAVADKLGAVHRRESLRTSRSLHVLMAGYMRQSALPPSGPHKSAVPSSPCRRWSLATAEPAQVLARLRVVQEQCARIAERVRRRTSGTADDRGARPARRPPRTDERSRQADALSEARRRLAAGLEYVDRIRRLTDAAVSDVRRDRHELRALLLDTCAACAVAGQARPDRSSTIVDIAGHLERACFALFARLDRTVARCDRPDGAAHDVTASCLRAVQTRRANAVRRARDVAYRVNDFRKAVNRLLLAAAPNTARRSAVAVRTTTRGGGGGGGTSAAAGRVETRDATRAPRKARGKPSVSSAPTPPLTYSTVTETSQVPDAVPITVLCPPPIGSVEYQ